LPANFPEAESKGQRCWNWLCEVARDFTAWTVPQIAGLAFAAGFAASLGLNALHLSKYLGGGLALVTANGPLWLAVIYEWLVDRSRRR
jgi:hypothetical protein